MDAAAYRALQDLARDALSEDLNEVMNRLTTLERLLGMVREKNGAPERRAAVVELRRRGFSINAIAKSVNAHPNTVAHDLAVIGEPPPRVVRGLDGRRTQPHHRPPAP